jgi:hypothetical protein
VTNKEKFKKLPIKEIAPKLVIFGFLLIFYQLVAYSKFLRFMLIIFMIVVLFFMLKLWLNNGFIKKIQTYYSVHVFGHKRRGKDLSTQIVIIRRFKKQHDKLIKRLKKIIRKHKINILIDDFIKVYYYYYPRYLSNIDYGYGVRQIDLTELKLKDEKTGKLITYDDVLTGRVKKMLIIKNVDFEGLDLYISDAQIGLPNTEHNSLDKMFPWLPVFIALSGQLYNMNIVVNTQEYIRLWTKLRGQQDAYFRALKTVPLNKSKVQKIWHHLPILKKYIFIKVRYFEEQQSAEQNILPFKAPAVVDRAVKPLHLGAGLATKEQFDATYGKIKDLWTVIRIKDIRYDSRIYHEILFGYKAPKSI